VWKRKTALVLVPFAALAIVLLWPSDRQQEPQYKGRPLSYWVILSSRKPAPHEAEEAISAIGTNALPLLLNWIRYERPAWRTKLVAAASHVSEDLTRAVISRSERLASASADAFRELGTNGLSAVPQLKRLVNRTSAPETALRAASILLEISGLALPPNAHFPQRVYPDFSGWDIQSICLFMRMNRTITRAALADPDPLVRQTAEEALGQPEVVQLPLAPLHGSDTRPELVPNTPTRSP
jgi:hypothetical protein